MESLVILGLIAAYVWFAGTSGERSGRKRAKALLVKLQLASDLDVLRTFLSSRDRGIRRAARDRRGDALPPPAPWRKSGYVYIAKARLRTTWTAHSGIPHLSSSDETVTAINERFQAAGNNNNLFKIGHTQRDPAARVAELNAASELPYKTLYQPFTFWLFLYWKVGGC